MRARRALRSTAPGRGLRGSAARATASVHRRFAVGVPLDDAFARDSPAGAPGEHPEDRQHEADDPDDDQDQPDGRDVDPGGGGGDRIAQDRAYGDEEY